MLSIDADELIKKYGDWYGCEPSDIGAFKTIIEKLPSVEPKNDYKKALDCILAAYLNPEIRHDILEKFVFETFSVGEVKSGTYKEAEE